MSKSKRNKSAKLPPGTITAQLTIEDVRLAERMQWTGHQLMAHVISKALPANTEVVVEGDTVWTWQGEGTVQ